ncbi:MAG: hypothetical protein GY786_03500 [Proteobacteria bacterium]|nr:hypothetical protein [Pseudomonadota bacterium]
METLYAEINEKAYNSKPVFILPFQNIFGIELGKRRRAQSSWVGFRVFGWSGCNQYFDSCIDVMEVVISEYFENKALDFTGLYLLLKSLIIDFGAGEFNKAVIDPLVEKSGVSPDSSSSEF